MILKTMSIRLFNIWSIYDATWKPTAEEEGPGWNINLARTHFIHQGARLARDLEHNGVRHSSRKRRNSVTKYRIRISSSDY